MTAAAAGKSDPLPASGDCPSARLSRITARHLERQRFQRHLAAVPSGCESTRKPGPFSRAERHGRRNRLHRDQRTDSQSRPLTVGHQFSSKPALPLTGGGTDNTAFLRGTPSPTSNPDFAPDANAQDALVTATFWIETVQDSPNLQLQYTQTVLLNFKGLSWPHVTVGTLTLTQADNPSIKTIDPTLPDNLVPKSPNGKN
jgi:hypothetical protein